MLLRPRVDVKGGQQLCTNDKTGLKTDKSRKDHYLFLTNPKEETPREKLFLKTIHKYCVYFIKKSLNAKPLSSYESNVTEPCTGVFLSHYFSGCCAV